MIIVCDDCGVTLETSEMPNYPPESLRWNIRFNPMLDIICTDSKNVRQQRDELREALQMLLDARSQTATIVLAAQKNAYDVLARYPQK